MLFAEREPFVHSGVQSDDSAWNKAGTSFGTKLWQRSRVVGWRSTSSSTRRRLRRHESGYLSVIGILRQLLQHQSPRANKRLEPELALLRKFKEWMASCESFVEYSYEVAAIK